MSNRKSTTIGHAFCGVFRPDPFAKRNPGLKSEGHPLKIWRSQFDFRRRRGDYGLVWRAILQDHIKNEVDVRSMAGSVVLYDCTLS
jgi:hypothetical protein